MSCYIKSKDGIFGVLNLGEFYTDNVRDYPKEYALEVADNPIELCDGFYIDVENMGFSMFRTFIEFDKAKEKYESYGSQGVKADLIGFIKTDKGLLFCLKYNKEKDIFITFWENISFENYNQWIESVLK